MYDLKFMIEGWHKAVGLTPARYNMSLEFVNLPSSLQSLTFGEDFNQSIQPVTLPSSLRSLSLGDAFNQSLEDAVLPDSLQFLTFGSVFLALIRTVGEIFEGMDLRISWENGFVEGEAVTSQDKVRMGQNMHSPAGSNLTCWKITRFPARFLRTCMAILHILMGKHDEPWWYRETPFS